MPVTAKLSKRFYQRFGDDLTNELVDWFNSVDATYQSDLKELNENNFVRFDAKLEQRTAGIEARIDGLEARLEQRATAIEARFDGLETRLDSKMERRFAEQRETLTAHLAAFESRITRWLFTLWTTAMVTIAGLAIALLHSR